MILDYSVWSSALLKRRANMRLFNRRANMRLFNRWANMRRRCFFFVVLLTLIFSNFSQRAIKIAWPFQISPSTTGPKIPFEENTPGTVYELLLRGYFPLTAMVSLSYNSPWITIRHAVCPLFYSPDADGISPPSSVASWSLHSCRFQFSLPPFSGCHSSPEQPRLVDVSIWADVFHSDEVRPAIFE